MNPAADYPAAHSMDSGWFAVDKNGRIAHFSTGEGGAMPMNVGFTTGEAGVANEAEELWWQHILPWLARNMSNDVLLDVAPDLYALFDTEEHAAAAATALSTSLVPMNELFISVPFDGDKFVAGVDRLEGFVGFAPSESSIEWGEVPAEFIPIVKYTHGEWTIPGHYERVGIGHDEFRLDEVPAGLATMHTDFGEAEELQLADFYSNEECASWSQADLRDGTMPQEPPRQGFFGWLFDLLRGGS